MKAWLVSQSGPALGLRHPVAGDTTRVGRSSDNDVVIQGADAASVSQQHLEIRRERAGFRVRDLDSTNGTYLNGERIQEADLTAPAILRLGAQGPELAFIIEEANVSDLDKTIALPPDAIPDPPPEPPLEPGAYDALLSEAVDRARNARGAGFGNQTMTIMRDTLHRALRHSHRRLYVVIGMLALSLLTVSGYASWKITHLRSEKNSIDHRIQEIETRMQEAIDNPAEIDRLITQLGTYEDEAEQLERNFLYRVSVRQSENLVTREIRTLMAEFGAEVYSVPNDFTERVNHYIKEYQGSNRPLVEHALSTGAPQIEVMRSVLEQQHLPQDLAYIPLVESALTAGHASAAGAAGLWQMTPATARSLGLRVGGGVDERLNLRKATLASCKYLRDLILDFGSGSSVMLALAAYNSGPSKVKQAIQSTVRDPIKQRSFWYLYRIRALPKETREYVPKVVAAMIIGRNPQHFGF